MINKCQLVRDTCSYVAKTAKSVKFIPEKLEPLIQKFHYTQFNDFQHHNIQNQDPEQTLRYLLILDSLNFCFWPLSGFQYSDLATNVKSYITKYQGPQQFAKLTKITEEQLNKQIFGGIEVPLADQRARIIRQMSTVVTYKFQGSVTSIIKACNKSAVKLLSILTQNFPNFQDHSIYNGKQIHFYKRAQIFIGDIWAKFEGKGLGQFEDIKELTMFPDYRVPQILNDYGILKYSNQLQQKIENKTRLFSGSEEEVQIRALSVVAVEKIKDQIKRLKGKEVHSVETDWFLWELGENNLKNIKPHHRVLTIYY